MPETKNASILELLEKNELNISLLYALYAQKIPSKKSFWERLAQEETSHAASIKNDLLENSPESSIVENNFTRGIIRYIAEFIQKEINFAKNKTLTHPEALQTALRIERSMLEKKCFEIFTPNNTTLQDILKKMNQETEKHTEIILKELRNFNPLSKK